MSTTLSRIIYCSEFIIDYKSEEIYKILKTARQMNPKYGIGGHLLYGNGYFLQIIEGPTPSINGLYKNISSDKRHKNHKLIIEEKIQQIEYEKWSMSFANITEILDKRLETLLDEIGLVGEFNPYVLSEKKAKAVLKLFLTNEEFLSKSVS